MRYWSCFEWIYLYIENRLDICRNLDYNVPSGASHNTTLAYLNSEKAELVFQEVDTGITALPLFSAALCYTQNQDDTSEPKLSGRDEA